MGYRYRRNRWGWRGFPFPLFFILFFIGGHSFSAFLISAGVMVIIFLLVRFLLSSSSQNRWQSGQSTMNQPYQQYQPYQPQNYSDPANYQPYQQGYQSPQYDQGYQNSQNEQEQEYQYPETPSEYRQYEQPQAQYPQHLPPMEQ